MAVVKAVEKNYSAKAAQDRAIKEMKDARPFSTELANARAEERRAVAALDKHKKEHGCMESAG